MGVSGLRLAACAGALVGALLLGVGAAGPVFADPGGAGHRLTEEEPGKGTNNARAGLAHVLQRILGEHGRRVHSERRSAPWVKVGSEPDIERGAEIGGTDTGADIERGAQIGGTEPAVTSAETHGDASDDIDNTVVSVKPEVDKKRGGILGHPFSYYLLELRRGGGDWWNAERIVSRFEQAINPDLAAPRKPTPTPAPAPAFRGGAPEPEPVLDASGGVAGGGSDYQATGFGGAPVLSAPIVAVPLPPPAAARFPSFPPAATSPGPAAVRGVTAESGLTAAQPTRATGGQEQAPAGTVKAMSGQAPQRGFTGYLRRPGLPQLAGAALPGVAGILVMTVAGGVVGHRQASAGRMIRASGAARYLP